MPNKSDSAGKLHQYYTTRQLKMKFPTSKSSSPLDDLDERNSHISLFSTNEINSLEKIGELSAEKIIRLINDVIIDIKDIGVSSGAIGNDNTDDLLVSTKTKGDIGLSLKCSTNISQILSKNMGAKSLLKDYFNADAEQVLFNNAMNELHLIFLNSTLKTELNTISKVKKIIKADATKKGLTKARFNDKPYNHMNAQRSLFLNALRNKFYDTILTLTKTQLSNACNLILDTGKHHIIGEYKSKKEKVDYIYLTNKTPKDIKSVSKRGNDSVVIEANDYVIGFRYKFESGITSSIKLVGDYQKKKR